MIRRERHLQGILHGLEQFPVLALLGPRQVGKTTLARQLAAEWRGPHHHFDLEDPDDLARLSDPSFALRPLTGLMVLDEIQTQPQRFPLLRVLADRPEAPARFMLLGSAAPALLRNTSEQSGRHVHGLAAAPLACQAVQARSQGPKVYLRDTGMLHSLLGITDQKFETKLTRSPKVTASVRTAQQALALDHLYVLCHAPEQATPWPLAPGLTAVPLQTLSSVAH